VNVTVEELEKITAILLERLRKAADKEVKLSTDYFWNVPTKELYDPYKKPKELDLGQLSDDMHELRRLLKDDEAISYDLERLANILTAISNELAKKNVPF
jgi:hypothetical protein